MDRYLIGTVVIRAVDWPASWVAFADATWRRLDQALSGPALPEVAVSLGARPAPGRDEGGIVVEDLSVRTTQAGCEVSSGEAFSAVYDHHALTLRVDAHAHLEVPRIILGNAVRGMISYRLPMFDAGLMIHSCSGVLDGQGVVVAGVSTAGKTTLAKGMKRARYLSDDISLVASCHQAPTLLPSPFFGIEGDRGADEGGPLKAVAIMDKRLEGPTQTARLSPLEALSAFTRHVVCWSKDADLQQALLKQIGALTGTVPFVHVQRSLEQSSDGVLEQILHEAQRA